MTELVFDADGQRYYETGVSNAVFFPHTGGSYVWNGLTSVDISPTGGEIEKLYYDGVQRMERQGDVDFAGTINVVHTPRDFDICEGTQRPQPGMKTHFHKRVRFNLVWKTIIGNDENERFAEKLHIVYNALVAPPQRSFQTVSDIATPQARSIPITAIPCGVTAYYTFDSRDGDFSPLWDQIKIGNLPACSGLAGLVGVIIPDEEVDCINMLEDFEAYNPGQALDFLRDSTTQELAVSGLINNGFDIVEIAVDGAFEDNDSAATPTIVGTGDILNDEDPATYITSGEGDIGYTVGIDPLTGGYVTGCRFELHISMSIDGGVDPEDPSTVYAEAQAHISTDPEGLLTVGGFSDGAQEGMAFKLTDVTGGIVDYVIPLKMDSWINSDIDDVVAALMAGAYLNILGATNFNSDPAELPVTVNVYEAKIFMINNTDSGRYLREDPETGEGLVEQHIRTVAGGSTDLETAFTTFVDFKIKEIPDASGAPGSCKIVEYEDNVPGSLKAEFSGTTAICAWRDEAITGTIHAQFNLEYNLWYRVRVYWTWGVGNVKVWARDRPVVYLIDRNLTPSNPPTANVIHQAGKVTS